MKKSKSIPLLAAALALAACLPLHHADAQNIFVSNSGNGTISEFDSNGGLVNPTFASGLSVPAGLAFDSRGNLYAANGGNNTISKIDSLGAVTLFASGLSSPVGLAFDTSGNLYVANQVGNTISEFNSSGTLINAAFASGLSGPQGLAFDASGNLYVANQGGNTISEFNSSGTLINAAFASDLSGPKGLAFDASGNLYVANSANFITEITPSGGTGTVIVHSDAGLNDPRGLAFDSSGNLYAANFAGNTISKITPGRTVSTFSSDSNLNQPNSIAVKPAAVPEPSTWVLLGLGMGALGFLGFRRRRMA